MTATERKSFDEDRFDLFAVRCQQMAELVDAGHVPFIWGVDVLYDAAQASGFANSVGDDVVQAMMRDAFMGVRR
jgi:hypothetical protein